MNYLFETEHFLLRKRIPEDIHRLPEIFSEGDMVPFVLKQSFAPSANAPDALTVEFRATGALAGEVVVKTPPRNRNQAKVLCCLCRDFQKNCFKAEIADAINLIL